MTSMLTAASAYQNQLKLMKASPAATESQDTGGAFADMIKNALHGAADTQRQAENLQVQSLTANNVEVSDLVTAISSAELSLNTVVAIRDKVINAYQEIIKMAI